MNWLGIVLCILYVLSPFYFIPILGWLDDVDVLGYMGCHLITSEKSSQ
jgi:uncharacterized membrane protein YkvA (DUF1232 family)